MGALLFAVVAWTARADLDGDGKSETLSVSCAKDPCEVSVGASTEPLELPGGYAGRFSAKVIDIDPTDKAKELLIAHRLPGEEEDPPWVFEVVTYAGGYAHVTRLASTSGYNTGVATVANKTLTLVYDDCPERTTIVYERVGDGIVESTRSKLTTHKVDDCSG